MLTISTRFKNFTLFSNPYSSHFLNRFFNLAVDVSCISVFILVGANEFITVKVFLRFFTFGTWFQDFTSYGNPDGSYFLNRFVDMCCISVFVLVSTNEFITVKVFLRFFTIGTWFQDLTSHSNPNRSYFLNRFVDVSCITILIFVCTNEFITIKVFLRFFTIGTWFQYLTSYSDPNCSYLLNRFLYRFFYWFVDMSSNRTLNLGFNKFITWEVIFRFEIRRNNWRFESLTSHRNPTRCFKFCHRTFLYREWGQWICRNFWSLGLRWWCHSGIRRVLRLWAIWCLWLFRFFSRLRRWCFRFFSRFWCWGFRSIRFRSSR